MWIINLATTNILRTCMNLIAAGSYLIFQVMRSAYTSTHSQAASASFILYFSGTGSNTNMRSLKQFYFE